MNDDRTCIAKTLFAAFSGLILTSTVFAQGNSAPDAVDDVIIAGIAHDPPAQGITRLVEQIDYSLFAGTVVARFTALEGGGFVMIWESLSWDNDDIYSQQYSATGSPVGTRINATIEDLENGSEKATLVGGGYVYAYTDFVCTFYLGVPPTCRGGDHRLNFRLVLPAPLLVDSSYPLDVFANDSDPNGDVLTLTHVNGNAIVEDGSVTLPSGVSITLLGGELVYDPRSAPFAIALPKDVSADDNFTYTISDGVLTDTANVTVTLTGVNDAPSAESDELSAGEDADGADVTATLLSNDTDPDTGTTAQLAISAIDTTGTQGQVNFNAGNVTYSPNGAYESLAVGQTSSDTFHYTITDPDGLIATAAVTVTISGANDAPTADDDALSFSEEEGAKDVTALLLASDFDLDDGETAQLLITAIDSSSANGLVTLSNGSVSYDPNGAFNWLEDGQSITDQFQYTISDPHGATATATATVTIQGFAGYRLTIDRTGLGAGSITSEPSGIGCGSGGACEALFPQDENVTLSVEVEPTTRFQSWGGDCASANQSACALTMNQNRYAFARFELENPPAGRIVAATLPGARSGYIGGGDITVFMTVLSRQSTPAQSCRVTAPNNPPFTLSYRQVNARNEVIGDANPLFDLGNGGAINFVIALTPTQTTDANGYTFLPQIECENANLSPIEGVNSVLVSIGAAPVPDILSIGATPTADGVVRISATGNRISFMSAAALNIGAGDGSAGAGEATVTASVDTGAASLPLTLEVCETTSTGGCITPRGVDNVTTVFESNVVKYFGVFVRANGDSTVPFSPANARVFLRFADANGTIRSATSAAVFAPSPAGDQPEFQSAMPVGRWSVLVRQGDGEWPSLTRGSLYVLPNGTAILDDSQSVSRLSFEGFVAANDIGRFAANESDGAWTPEGSIQTGPILSEFPGDLWGVRDARSEIAPDWGDLSGRYGDGIQIASDGSISGTIAGCMISGRSRADNETATGLRVASVNLMRCEASGEYHAIIDAPANDQAPALLLSGSDHGWRMVRNQ
ncbi:MAG: hypothetical protein DHS20C06_00410 [Hyphobacterium sp.]|nr:MAG: hypothetical protein DHS20C06_00410 [Hyphobacterium sp.]